MSKEFPVMPLEKAIRYKSNFIGIDDFQMYKRCRVQAHAQGIVERDLVPGTEIKTKRQQVCHTNDFLVAEIDAKVGGFGIVPESLDGAIVSSHYFLFTIDESVLDCCFLDFFIRTSAFFDQVKAKGSTNYAAIHSNDVLGYEIPLPPLSEQQRIVARIEELAAKIEEARGLRREAVVETESLMQVALHTMFNDLGGKQNTLRTLRKSATIYGGGTPSKNNYALWQGVIPWVSPKDMKSSDIFDTEDHISEEALELGVSRLIPVNSVLLVTRSGILRRTLPIAINRVPVTINQDMKALVPLDDLSCDFLAWWFRSKEDLFLDNVKGGTTVQSLMWDKVQDFAISVPSSTEQQRIVTYLNNLQAKVDAMKHIQSETSAELDSLLPSILDKAFNGEL